MIGEKKKIVEFSQSFFIVFCLIYSVVSADISFAETTIFTKDKLAAEHREVLAAHSTPATFQLDGILSGLEVITFELVGINGVDTITWVDEYGDPVSFTVDKTRPIPVYSPLDLLITKPVTVNDVGVKLVQ